MLLATEIYHTLVSKLSHPWNLHTLCSLPKPVTWNTFWTTLLQQNTDHILYIYIHILTHISIYPYTHKPSFLHVHTHQYAMPMPCIWGFPGSSTDKESTCNVGDPASIPGLGRSPGERIGYPLQYSWAFLVIQMVKNLPAVQKTWVRSLGWEDPLEDGMATHSSILAWRIPMDGGAWWATVHRVTKSQARLSD